MTRYLVTGAGGMLGQDLQTALARAAAGGRQVTALTRAELDVTDRGAVRAAVAGHDVVMNASAYTNVDGAEAHEDDAYAVNALGVENLAIAAYEQGAKFLTISTDYVFDGSGTMPYAEDAPRDPLNAYGRTKAAGEELALAANPDGTFIVRTAWLYGEHGPSFVRTMANLELVKDTLDVVGDQQGQPTSTRDLSVRLRELGERALAGQAPAGIYHASASGHTSKFGLAQAIFAGLGADPQRVRPTTSDRFPLPAPRPAWSVLGHDRWAAAGLPPMRHWESALADSLAAVAARP